jgi:hypothetical protein
MGKLSNYGENIIGSEILKISGKIKAKNEKVYNYTIGDFDSQVFHYILKENILLIIHQIKYLLVLALDL